MRCPCGHLKKAIPNKLCWEKSIYLEKLVSMPDILNDIPGELGVVVEELRGGSGC